jgi:hypothetical protein
VSPPVPAAELTDELLLARYRPWLYYDSLESFRADSAAVLPEHVFDDGPGWSYANSLKRQGGSVIASARPRPGQQQLDLGFLGGSRYRSGASARSTDYLDAFGRDYVADAQRMHADPQYADRVYGYVAREADGTRWLQYWFFYYYNDKSFWGIGVHEGDWEMIQLRLDASGVPTIATYAQHNEGEGYRFADLARRKVGDYEVPIVYVGRGSHASFATAGRHQTMMWPLPPDYADGKGQKLRPALVAISDATSWVPWPGKWGSSDSSPRGPAQHGQWNDPGGWHREVSSGAVRGARRRAAAAPPPPEPPAPRITVKRVDDRAVVEYSFPARLPAGTALPAGITVSVDKSGDDQPPVTRTFRVRGRAGAIAHPLPLEDAAYVVRAASLSEDGASSKVVSRRLARGRR